MEHSLVIIMPTALTLLEVSCALASLDTLEMVSLVKVCRGIGFQMSCTMLSYLLPPSVLPRVK